MFSVFGFFWSVERITIPLLSACKKCDAMRMINAHDFPPRLKAVVQTNLWLKCDDCVSGCNSDPHRCVYSV